MARRSIVAPSASPTPGFDSGLAEVGVGRRVELQLSLLPQHHDCGRSERLADRRERVHRFRSRFESASFVRPPECFRPHDLTAAARGDGHRWNAVPFARPFDPLANTGEVSWLREDRRGKWAGALLLRGSLFRASFSYGRFLVLDARRGQRPVWRGRRGWRGGDFSARTSRNQDARASRTAVGRSSDGPPSECITLRSGDVAAAKQAVQDAAQRCWSLDRIDVSPGGRFSRNMNASP